MLATASWWYLNVTPHMGATAHTTFIWGLLHGLMLAPNFLYELLVNNHSTIYQTPNDGTGYNFGFAIGTVVVPGGIFGYFFR